MAQAFDAKVSWDATANQVIVTNLTAAHFDLKGPLLELQEQI